MPFIKNWHSQANTDICKHVRLLASLDYTAVGKLHIYAMSHEKWHIVITSKQREHQSRTSCTALNWFFNGY